MDTIKALKYDREYRFAIVNVDIVGSSTLSKSDGDANVKKTKQNLFEFFAAIANRHPCIPHSSGDGFFFLYPLSSPADDYDIAAQACISLQENLAVFNEDFVTGNLLSIPVQTRITAHAGMLIHAKDPGNISGSALDTLLKNERSIGLPEHLTITHEVFRNLSPPVKRRFRPRDAELEPKIASLEKLYDYLPANQDRADQKLIQALGDEIKRLHDLVSASIKAFSSTSNALGRFEEATPDKGTEKTTTLWKVLEGIREKYSNDYEDLWVSEAKEVIRRELQKIEWDFGAKCVYAFDDDRNTYKAINSLDALQGHLVALSDSAFYANVPFDEGEAVWQASSEDWVNEALEEYSDELREIGWDF